MHSEQRDKHNIEVEDMERRTSRLNIDPSGIVILKKRTLSPAPDHLLFGSPLSHRKIRSHTQW
jgi:hypothetical protein